MPENQQPKKQPRSKAKKVNINPRKRWQDIVQNVDKKEVPVDILYKRKYATTIGNNVFQMVIILF